MSFASLDDRRRTARRRLTLLAAGLVMAAAGVTAFLVLNSGGSNDALPGASTSSAAPAARPSAGSTTPDVLPKAREVKDGVPVGYPHTPEGAVSAAAHFYDVWDGFNPFASERQARAVAAPRSTEKMASDAFQIAVAARSDAGLNFVGESDNANYLTYRSRGYRIDTASADRVKLWLLLDTQKSVKGITSSVVVVGTAEMVWADGDWKLVALMYPKGEPQPPEATPDSADAAEKGWRSIAYEK
ncbi:hypothetical protein ACFP1Z_32450 [Streptomyces gamaensis]|uniref:DUF8175 domain-containing protein n=1 Tax=Streptomyces gamaensis TaxID=1763542 RepID=A0ABW0ZCR2_9ACTN